MESSMINYYPTKRKLIYRVFLIMFILIILGIVVFLLLNYFVMSKIVTLNPTPGTTITIDDQTANKIVIVATSNQSKRLHQGHYLIKYSGGNDYQDITDVINVNKPITLKTPELNFVDAKLSQILISERSLINGVLSTSYDQNNYQIDQEQLFKQGEWCGVTLIPNSWYDPTVPADYIPRPVNENNTLNILRVILNKDNGRWRIVAQPAIIFSKADYPHILPDVVSGVDKLGF